MQAIASQIEQQDKTEQQYKDRQYQFEQKRYMSTFLCFIQALCTFDHL